MINKKEKLSQVRQCQLLNVTRSNHYYQPAAVPEADLQLMKVMDEIHIKRPFLGVRRITDELHDLGYKDNRKRAHRLMKVMGIQAIYPKPNTSKKHGQHKIYPYLLRGLNINRPNQVWATDITYIPMEKGFIYLMYDGLDGLKQAA